MTDKSKDTDGYHVTVSFVTPNVITGFVEGKTEEEATKKIMEDFDNMECVKILGVKPMDSETARKMVEGDYAEETTTTTLQ